jgi:hypothetical protein
MTHRATLARELDDEGWRAVLGAYSALASELSSGHWEEQVTQAYERGLAALEPLMTYKRRHWWQRVFRRG